MCVCVCVYVMYIYVWYTILYYTILYYTILYYTMLYYTILYYTILYYTILYYTTRGMRQQHRQGRDGKRKEMGRKIWCQARVPLARIREMGGEEVVGE
jgi:hypothetical protein